MLISQTENLYTDDGTSISPIIRRNTFAQTMFRDVFREYPSPTLPGASVSSHKQNPPSVSTLLLPCFTRSSTTSGRRSRSVCGRGPGSGTTRGSLCSCYDTTPTPLVRPRRSSLGGRPRRYVYVALGYRRTLDLRRALDEDGSLFVCRLGSRLREGQGRTPTSGPTTSTELPVHDPPSRTSLVPLRGTSEAGD